MAKRLYLLLCCSLASFASLVAQNAFNFDGTDDYGAAANGSALIANASGISLSLWVNPETLVSGYPDFGGMAGFRNESNCDFYLLQLNSNNVEARLRNSSGTVYTITYNSGMNMNAWNHFVLVFNGSTLKLYHDGIQVSSISASGSITSTTTPFNIGYVPFGGANFHFDGSVEDVGLWDKALSATEVNNLYTGCGYDLSAANLKAAYEFNQGIASANNTAISLFLDSKGSSNASINGAARSGASSNFVTGLLGSFADSLTITACKEYTSPLGTKYLSSGFYVDSVSGASGCDSIYYIDLTINNVDSTVSHNGGTLSSNDTSAGVSYQWLDCNTGQVIIGVTNRSFSPTLNGNYAVIVSNGNCIDTSACFAVTASGVGLSEYGRRLKLYPNPSKGIIHLELAKSWSTCHFEILDVRGNLLKQGLLHQGDLSLNLSDLKNGMYFLNLRLDDSYFIQRSFLINSQ